MKITHSKDFNPYPQAPLVSLDQLKAIAVDAKPEIVEQMHQPLLNTLSEFEINTALRICHFLAQVLHESGSFRYMEETASGDAYEGRKDLGNIEPGDGRRFKGRGLIQLTGRANYLRYSKYANYDFIKNPEVISKDLQTAVDVAGWFWKTNNLNPIADNDDVQLITKRVNGGLTGFKDRKRHLDRAKHLLMGAVN